MEQKKKTAPKLMVKKLEKRIAPLTWEWSTKLMKYQVCGINLL